MPPAATLRRMTADDVEAGLRLCRLSHWNQVARDWAQFLRLTPGGATVAVDGDGRVIGSVATMRYATVPDARDAAPAAVAWIAMVLVDPAHRGSGIGTALLERGLADAADVATIGLDATPLGQPLYEKLGFRATDTLTRMQWATPGGPSRSAGDAVPQVRPATSGDREAIAALDARATGLDRHAMLEWLQVGAPELCWVCDGAHGIDGAILGRHGHLGSHVGPLLATSTQMAAALLRASLAAQHDRAVFVDIADDRPGWRQAVEAAGFRAQRPFTRMYRGNCPPPGDASRLFAIIGPEFG